MATKVIANNKKAFFDYQIDEQYTCGMRLSGTEIKSIRNGHCSIKEAYCLMLDGELFIRGMYIKEYEFGSYNNHVEVYDRKILVTKQELLKLKKHIEQKGYTILPLKVLIVNGWAKMEIGIGKGKKLYNKRETIKEKDIKRDLDREIK